MNRKCSLGEGQTLCKMAAYGRVEYTNNTNKITQDDIRRWDVVPDMNCCFCFQPCERYSAPTPEHCFDPRNRFGEGYLWPRLIERYRERRSSLLKELAEIKRNIHERFNEGADPEEISQDCYLHVQKELVKLERYIELKSGIYCDPCSFMLENSMILMKFH